jgi:SPFH domain / Band 7 family
MELFQSVLQLNPVTNAEIIEVSVLIVAAILAWYLIGRGVFIIKATQVGVLTRKFTGQRMPKGQIIARHKQIGVQADTLTPGLYYRLPIIWSWEKFAITVVAPDQIGTVESIDGEPLLSGRFTGDEVACNRFQDGEAFLENHGKKGQQVGILTPGSYRINPRLFNVQIKAATVIDSDSTGLVTAEDGIPLPSDLIIAPQPLEVPDPAGKFSNARSHKHFQDGQAFIDSGGYRGPQLDTLQPGKYFINDLLFTVAKVPKYEVEPGFVAVLRSNVGRDLQRSDRLPRSVETVEVPVTPSAAQQKILGSADTVVGADQNEKITADIESVLISDKLQRGIFDQPLAPGTYNLNTIAYTAYAVPTSAIMIDWADSSKISAPTMSGVAATTRTNTRGQVTDADQSSYPYTGDQSTKGVSYFNFSQLEVISADGFQLEVGVRMVIRIRQENAAFVIARFGTVFNLIQQIVHPLIDSSFRNDAGSKKALEFFQSRTQLQQYVFDNARKVFGLYHVEAQGLLISFIRPADAAGQNLLATQTLKEIAIQQQTQLEQQANAEAKRIVVQEQTARANLQPQVVSALLQIDIQKNQAEAVRRQSEGLRDYNLNLADGTAGAIWKNGKAQADVYTAQVTAIGQERVGMLKALEEIKGTRLVPETLVMSGDQKDGTSPIITAWFAKAIGAPASVVPVPTPRDGDREYKSGGYPRDAYPGAPEGSGGSSSSPPSGSMPPIPPVPGSSSAPAVMDITKQTPVSLQNMVTPESVPPTPTPASSMASDQAKPASAMNYPQVAGSSATPPGKKNRFNSNSDGSNNH